MAQFRPEWWLSLLRNGGSTPIGQVAHSEPENSKLTHDLIGNLVNDGEWNYTWQAGRQLSGMSKAGTAIQFEYDHNGLRTR